MTPKATSSRASAALILTGVLSLSTLALAIVTNGNLLATVVPMLVFVLVYVMVKVPLRYPALVYIAVVMTIDNPIDQFAAGQYKSPLYPLGQMLSAQLKTVIPSGALIMSGLDIFLFGAFVIYGVRRARGSQLDREGFVPVPFPLVAAAWACLLAVLIAAAWGMARGGTFRFVQWQMQRNIYLPLFCLLFQVVFPSWKNYKGYLSMLVVLACIRAVFALLLRQEFPNLEYVTSHADSMLFGTVSCLLLIRMLLGLSPREFWKSVAILVLLVAGMVANDRRLVWVEIAVAFVFVFFMTQWTPIKRRAVQILIGASPLIAVYFAAGWSSGSKFFAPVATVRSMVDSKSDGSTMWRELENFNLVATYSRHPVLGSGFGHPFELALPMPDITGVYELEPYVPHNSIVGLWAFTGYVGFTMIWSIPVVGLYFAARTVYMAQEKSDRIESLTCFCCIVIYMLQCYGDLGLGSVIGVFLLAPSMAMVGKLAVKVGAWPRLAPSPVVVGPEQSVDASVAPPPAPEQRGDGYKYS